MFFGKIYDLNFRVGNLLKESHFCDKIQEVN